MLKLLKSILEIIGWAEVWDYWEAVKHSRWVKAMFFAIVNAAALIVGWIMRIPYAQPFALGGLTTAVAIFLWDWFGSRKASYLKPLAPRALDAIDSRIEASWERNFGDQYQDKKADIKRDIRKFLIWAGMVKTHQEYAQDQIDKIMADKTHPYHNPDDNWHHQALRDMVKWQRLAEGLKFKR